MKGSATPAASSIALCCWPSASLRHLSPPGPLGLLDSHSTWSTFWGAGHYKLDSLSRSLKDGINTLTDWLNQGVRIVSVTQQLDFSGATGQLVAAVLFAVAQMEQETRRERQAAGIAAAKAAGVYIGRQPGTTKARPARAKQLRDKGNTVPEIAQAMGVSERTVFNYLAG